MRDLTRLNSTECHGADTDIDTPLCCHLMAFYFFRSSSSRTAPPFNVSTRRTTPVHHRTGLVADQAVTTVSERDRVILD